MDDFLHWGGVGISVSEDIAPLTAVPAAAIVDPASNSQSRQPSAKPSKAGTPVPSRPHTSAATEPAEEKNPDALSVEEKPAEPVAPVEPIEEEPIVYQPIGGCLYLSLHDQPPPSNLIKKWTMRTRT